MEKDRGRSKKRTKQLFQNVIASIFSKKETLTVSQWAERYRELEEENEIAGRWNNNITPYLVEIMDSFNDPYIKQITFCKSTQIGGTEAAINIIGWIITQNPSRTMIVYPTDDLAKNVSNDRLKPALDKIPVVKEKFLENKSKETDLKYKGMKIYLRSGGSPSKLASNPVRYLIFDEIDKMDGASKKEASPYNLALERTKTYKYSKKIYACSTPTLKTNYIWSLLEEAEEERHYFIPCPHCNEYIEIKWKQVKFAEDEEKRMTKEERAKTAIYVCQECGCSITDKEKTIATRKGEWRAVRKSNVGAVQHVGFWINSLYSVFVSWEDAVLEFLKSKEDPDKLQNFINSWLAEPWEDTKLKTNADLVLEKQTELEEFVVPRWAKLLTAGIDVQETSLYWTIRAWGNHMTSQNIAHGQVLSFFDIETIMNLEYKKEDGTNLLVALALMDSGDQTDLVYDFCANNSEWVLPVKGVSESLQSNYVISKINKMDSNAYGMQLVRVDTEKYKDAIAGRIRKQTEQGAWKVYKGCDRNYAEQVTAEHKVNVKMGNGKTKQKWVVKRSHADNHYLDAEVYAMAAAEILGVRSMHLQETKPGMETKQETSPEENWITTNETWI